jgi:hypothetical protein
LPSARHLHPLPSFSFGYNAQMVRVPTPVRKWLMVAGVFLLPVVGLVIYQVWQFHRRYPYGLEHCCAKQVGLALQNYADLNGGKFPTGGATPEASLSLLYPDLIDAGTLRGKAYPEAPARQLLESGQPLTPETCGWHYVDGLVMQRSVCTRIAIAWDKIGLDHNSGLLPHGGHSVIFMDGSEHVVCEADWLRFIAEQAPAWETIRRGGIPNPPPWHPDF